MKQPNNIQIGLVDDHSLFRNGIAALLKEESGVDILFEAANGIDCMRLLKQYPSVEVVLMDISMPLMDGYETTNKLKEAYVHIHVLALSMYDDDMAIIKMLKAGAGGYVLKESNPKELYRAIAEVNETGFYTNQLVSGRLIRSLQQESEKKISDIKITEKEIIFLKLCASEMTYKEIADKMGLAARSVDNYRQALFEKLEIKSRVGLVLYALKSDIISVNDIA
jgi:DNA-binding NarL/FixJ family response regulator